MAIRFKDTISINEEYTFPLEDGTADQVLATDGAGNISFVNGGGETVKIECKNTSGSTITKGTPVYVTGTVGTSFKVQVAPADASNSAKMPAVGLLETDLANNGEGYVVTGGLLKNLTTDPIDGTNTTSNDTIYVKAGGGLTMTKPTGSNLIQNIGKIGRVNSSNAGSVVVSSILRTNDVPNLTEGKIWVGSANNTIESTVVHIDETNTRIGINQNTPDVTLDITGTDAIQIPKGTDAERPTPESGMLRFNTTSAEFEGYNGTEWGAIGGSEVATVDIDSFTGDGTTVDYTLTSEIPDEKTTQVYIDGVYQSKSNYSVSGTTLTFSTAPPNGTAIEVVHFTSIAESTLNGSGTANYVTKWQDADTLANSVIVDNGTTVTIGNDTIVNGDLTVDTNTLFVDSTNNFVGIGTTTQTVNGEKLRIAGDLFINSAGSATVPSIAVGDSNSGIYASAAGQISITTQGNQRLNIDGNGNIAMDTNTLYVDAVNNRVGIGTASPARALEVNSGTASDIAKIGNNSGAFTFGYTPSLASIDLAASNAFRIRQGAVVPFYIKTDGSVGINNTSPNSPLQFNNSAETRKITLYEVANNNYQFYGFGVENNTLVYSVGDVGDSHVFFAGSGASTRQELMRIDGDGRVGIGTTSPNAPLHIYGKNQTNGTLELQPNSAKGTFASYVHYGTNGDWYIRSANASGNIIIQDTGGNVGIGTASPSVPLTVLKSVNSPTTIAQFQNTSNEAIVRIASKNDSLSILEMGDPDDYNVGAIQYSNAENSMRFKTADGERMRINSSGNVGIGETNPSSKLHIRNDYAYETSTTNHNNVHIRLGENNGDNYITNIDGHMFLSTSPYKGAGRVFLDDGATKSSSAFFYGKSTGEFRIHTGSGTTGTIITEAERFRITNDGNVGIGNVSPLAKLHVNAGSNASGVRVSGTSSSYTAMFVGNSSTGNALTYYDASNGDFSGSDYSWTGQYNDLSYVIATSPNSGPIVFRPRDTERMRITTDGKVGIGTTSPSYKLTVDDDTPYGGILIQGANAPGLTMLDESGTAKNLVYAQSTATAQGIIRISADDNNTGTDSRIEFKVDSAERMRIDSYGVQQLTTTSNNGYLNANGNGFELDVNRHPETGVFSDTGKSHARILMFGASGGSHIQFNTASANNTTATEKVRILSSGGITFNGDTATANALDDYEEGTWTITYNDIVNCSSVSTSGSPKYTKIGNVVHLAFEVSGGFTATGTETLFSFTLPFTAYSTSMDNVGTATFFIGTGANRFGKGSVFEGTTSNGKTFVYIPAREIQQSGTWGAVRVSLTYFTA